jgi:hypothetical protein
LPQGQRTGLGRRDVRTAPRLHWCGSVIKRFARQVPKRNAQYRSTGICAIPLWPRVHTARVTDVLPTRLSRSSSRWGRGGVVLSAWRRGKRVQMQAGLDDKTASVGALGDSIVSLVRLAAGAATQRIAPAASVSPEPSCGPPARGDPPCSDVSHWSDFGPLAGAHTTR